MINDQNPEGGDPTDPGKEGDPTNPKGAESLKGKVDERGVPLDAEERADYYQKLSADNDTKFKNSSKGVQGLLDKNKNLEDENERLKTSQNPHKGDGVSQSDFDELKTRQDETERRQAVIENKREFERQFKELVSGDEFKNIKGRREEFEEYGYEAENLNTPIEVLARSFQVVKGLIKSEPPKEGDEGREGIEQGTGGGSKNQPVSKKGFTTEEVETMRKTDPKKYNRLIKEGKLIISD